MTTNTSYGDFRRECFAEAREIDRMARLQISVQLGHNGEEITNAYLG